MQSSLKLKGSFRHSDKAPADIFETQEIVIRDCCLHVCFSADILIDARAVRVSPPAAPGHEFSPSLATELHFLNQLQDERRHLLIQG